MTSGLTPIDGCFTCTDSREQPRPVREEILRVRHVHFHLIPRPADLPPELRGPAVFELLRTPIDQCLSDERADEAAESIKAELARPAGGVQKVVRGLRRVVTGYAHKLPG